MNSKQHDPMCPESARMLVPSEYNCQCKTIARVREDQNQADTRMRTVFYEQGERDGYAAALRDAVEAVKAIGPTPRITGSDKFIAVPAAVAAIEALGGAR